MSFSNHHRHSDHRPLYARMLLRSHHHVIRDGAFVCKFRGLQLPLRVFEILSLLTKHNYFMHKYSLNHEINSVFIKFTLTRPHSNFKSQIEHVTPRGKMIILHLECRKFSFYIFQAIKEYYY